MEQEAVDRIEIYKGWCKKCGICIAFCPRDILEKGEDGYPVVKNPEKCTECGLCEIRCPDFAIVVNKNEQEPKE
jgi:2-oxoglutarate ferredoxin oxidoreductase subunit delta